MVDRQAIRQTLMRAALPAACLTLSAYFGFHAVSGPTGYFAWQEYKATHSVLAQQALASKQTKEALRREVAALDPHRVDPDLADLLIRKNLNVVRDDEVIVRLDDTK